MGALKSFVRTNLWKRDSFWGSSKHGRRQFTETWKWRGSNWEHSDIAVKSLQINVIGCLARARSFALTAFWQRLYNGNLLIGSEFLV